jgi:hypothetical protein
MTVSTQTAKSQYTGNGVTVAFTGSFPILAATHVTVIVTMAGVDSTKVLNTDYTISGVGGSTFTVTFGTAPANGTRVTIARSVPLTQELDLIANAALPSDQLEESYDKATMIDQQTNEAIARSLRFPVSDAAALVSELPTAALRAGKVIAFDADGDVIVSTEDLDDIEGSITAAAASAAAAAASASAASGDADDAETARIAAEAAEAAAVAAAASVPSFPIDPADTTFAATARVLGRKTTGAGTGEEVTISELLDFIGSAAQGDILYRGASGWARLGAGTSGQFLKTLGAAQNPAWDTLPSSVPDLIYLRNEQTAGTAGGGVTNGTWNTCILNTEVFDTGGHCSLSSNQFTLAAGTYEVFALVPLKDTEQSKLRIRNTTDSTTLCVGTSAYLVNPVGSAVPVTMVGRFTVAASKALEFQAYTNALVATSGQGLAAGGSEVEVYAQVWLKKVA